MNQPIGQSDTSTTGKRVKRIGCVGFLNSKPLIEGLTDLADPVVRLDVPSNLLEDLEQNEVDIALCPVIDYFRSTEPLQIVPVGCIASDGLTHTVRLFSRVPIESITCVHADVDSHTSIALLRVLMHELHSLHPEIVPYDALEEAAHGDRNQDHEAMLLIGDKVVTNAPPGEVYPYQMDFGEAWKGLTGLPFVFAIWMARQDCDLGDLPETLNRQRESNAQQIDAIAKKYADSHGWAFDEAHHYLEHILSYEVGPRELEAIRTFASKAAELGLIEKTRPLAIYGRSQ